MVDDQGKVLGGIATHEGVSHLYTPSDHDDYRDLRQFQAFGSRTDELQFLEVGADGCAYVIAHDAQAGALSLYRLDLATGRPGDEPVVRTKGFDFAGSLVNDTSRHRVVGVHYVTDAPGTVWFDPDLQKAQVKVDSLLPGRSNLLEPASCGCSTHMLLTSSSDRQPEEYYLFDRATEQLTRIGPSRPRH